MNRKLKTTLRWVIAVASAFFGAAFAASGGRELFVYEAGVHYPRVAAERAGSTFPLRVSFYLNVPTVAAFVELTCGVGAVLAAAAAAAAVIRKRRARRYLAAAALMLALAFAAVVVAALDFLSTAFRGVG